MRPKSDLRPYQSRLITRLYESNSVLAVLKMGGGKTIAGLTAIAELLADGAIRHALVIAPKRVANLVWPVEAKGWEHTRHLRISVLEGSERQRKAILDDWRSRDVTVCSVDNVQWLADELRATYSVFMDHPLYDLLVLDETSRFKSPSSKRGHALRKLASLWKIRWGFTGTPRPNSLADLWGPMTILAHGELWPGSYYKWQRKHFYPLDYNAYRWAPLPGQDEALTAEAAPYMFTLGEDELPGLPALNIVLDEVALPHDAQAAYRGMEVRLLAHTERGDVIASSAAVATGKLAQIANGYVYGEGGAADVTWLHKAKLGWLEEMRDLLDGEPALLVYEYLADRDIFREIFGNIPFLGGGAGDGVAADIVADWNSRRSPYVGLHPASGGHGLNLQAGGSTMLWVAPPWSPELWEQTIARLWRSGQAGRVTVRVCVAAGTVDEMKRLRVLDKLTAQEAFARYLRMVDLTGSVADPIS